VEKKRLEIRCPKLGHQVSFDYCEIEGGDIPCSRIIACWKDFIPVETYLRKKLTPEQWNRCFKQTPKEKISSIIELIEAAKARQNKA